MRVIAGSRRHLPLKSVPGHETRPTADKIKETLFNILQNQLYEIRFLDLFAGTGGIGIEALSRGASYAAFADSSRAACSCIRENLEFTKFTEQAMVYERDVLSALRLLEKHEPFDIVFMDPPYGQGLEFEVLSYLGRSEVIHADSVVIVEAGLDSDFSDTGTYGFCVNRVKTYKNCQHVFLSRLQETEEAS